jgi:hypothetical protein
LIKPTAKATIAASPQEVITFIADPSNAPRWMKALEVSELITPGPIRVGSQFREIQNAGGKRIETICEVVEYDGETRYAWKSVSDGPAQYGGGFNAVRVGDSAELRYDGWATTTGALAQREEAWARQAQREAEAELAAIKEAVESRPSVE